MSILAKLWLRCFGLIWYDICLFIDATELWGGALENEPESLEVCKVVKFTQNKMTLTVSEGENQIV